MSEDKTISKRKQIINAASEIVWNEGVVHLTLEAVAKRAGVSKGGLLYYFPNKVALIKGMLLELTDSFVEEIQERVKTDKQQGGKWSRAYVKATFNEIDSGSTMSAGLLAAIFTNPELLKEFQSHYAIFQENIEKDGINSTYSTIARLAVDGLWFAEIFGLAPLNKEQREQVFDELVKWTMEVER